MSNKIRKVEDLEIGKCYTDEGTRFIRVEECEGEKCATLVQSFFWISRIEREYLVSIDEECEEDYYVEISQEEFEKALDDAKQQFEKLYNELKANDDEKHY